MSEKLKTGGGKLKWWGDSVKDTGLPPDEAREMDDLLTQQALERIRIRDWSYAGKNKRLGKGGGGPKRT